MRFLFQFLRLLRLTASASARDKVPRLGAALAFYTMLSISPLLVVVTALAAMVFGEDAAQGQVVREIRSLTGDEGAQAVSSMFTNHSQAQGLFAAVIGLATLFIGATGVFAELQDAMDNPTKHTQHKTSNGFVSFVKDRLLSFTLVSVLGVFGLVFLLFSALMSGFQDWAGRYLPQLDWLTFANSVLSFAASAIMFAVVFRVLPHARPAWSDVAVGASLTAVFFSVGKHLIGLYLGRTAVGSAYGAAGSLVALLVWIYYSTQILLFGAEFTRIYAAEYSRGLVVEPEP